MKKFGAILINEFSMTSNEYESYYKTRDWYDELRSRDMTTDLTSKILERIKSAEDAQALKALKDVLHSEYKIHGFFDKAVALLENECKERPDDGLAAITLAEDYLYHLQNPEIALQKIAIAVPITNRTGHFRRHALNVKARALRALGDYGKFEECLQSIMAVTIAAGQMDVGREYDFIADLPTGAVSDEIIASYNGFLAQSKSNI